MGGPWFRLSGLAGICVLTGLIVVLTPDTPVAVIDFGSGVDRAEAAATLAEANAKLQRQPDLDPVSLQNEYRLVVGIEGREPAGLLWGLLGLGVGLLGTLAITRSGSRFGVHLTNLAIASAAFGLARALADYIVHSPHVTVPFEPVILAAADIGWIPVMVVFSPLLILTFPNGHLPGPRWRIVVGLSVVAAILLLSQLTNPLRYDGRALASTPWESGTFAAVFEAGIYLWNIALLAAAASFAVRIKRAGAEERRQLAWVGYGLAVAVVFGVTAEVALRFGGDPAVWGPVQATGFAVVLPATALAAIFRYRLYDIELVVRKSIVHIVLTFGVVAVYLSIVAAVGRLSQGTGVVPGVLAVSAAALIFEPGRLRLTNVVDRLVYPRRLGPYQSLAALSANLGSVYAAEEGLDELARAALLGTGAELAQVVVRLRGDVRLTATVLAGDSVGSGGAAPVPVGQMTHTVDVGESGYIGIRLSRREKLRAADRMLLEDLAAAARQFVANVELQESLAARLAETEARRAELTEARHRLRSIVKQGAADLERDLHDGAQARAVALSAQIGLARSVPDGPAASPFHLLAEIDAVQDEVARFAGGLHPTELSSRGVAEALRGRASMATGGIEITDEGGRASPEVEAALYFMASEAIQNAVKHAPDSMIEVRVRCGPSEAEAQVVDHGPGFDIGTHSPGRGLTNMTERLKALGGTLTVESVPDRGTAVVGRIERYGP